MKKTYLSLVFGLCWLILSAQNRTIDTALYLNEHYKERTGVFESEPVTKGRIIFLGNSITEFADWKELLHDTSVVNRGIAGDNTYGVLARLEEVIERKPEKLFLEIGVNDIGSGFLQQATLDNMLSIMEQVHSKSPATRIFVFSILPVNENVKRHFPQFLGKNKQINKLNQELSKIAIKAGCVFIDLASRLKDESGKLNKAYAMPDGIHLNAKGYNLWIMVLKKEKYL
jgi:lysophospholipase L1-like esterase